MEVSLSPSKQIMREKTTKRIGSAWKLNISWKIIKQKVTLKHRLHPKRASSIRPQLSPIRVSQHQVALDDQSLERTKTKKISNTPAPYRANSLATQLRITYDSPSNFLEQRGIPMTPTRSPKENMSTKWREMHGLTNWENLLDPLHSWVRREIVKYGEFAGATYDAFDFDPLSEFCGSSRYNRSQLFDELQLTKHGYKVTKYIYAMSHVDVPIWLERSQIGAPWSKDSNWMGYVAVSTDDETVRLGRRDIVVAWRGTVAPSEWFSDLKAKLQHIGHENENEDIKVEQGFLSIYKSKSESTRFNKLSASEQVMKEVTRLVNFYGTKSQSGDHYDQEMSLTITGHSLGGALALLNAYEAAKSLPGLFVSVVSFGAPMVGNMAFKHKLDQLGVKTLRVVVKQDIVPRLPGTIISNKILRKFNKISTRFMNWMYMHVGVELKLDTSSSPYLKQDFDLLGFHNLETYLHLVDGYLDMKSGFRTGARRDVALVNKSSDMLIEKLRIPEKWYQLPNKGLVCNSYGRWVKPSRKPEHVPSPLYETPPSSHHPTYSVLSITN